MVEKISIVRDPRDRKCITLAEADGTRTTVQEHPGAYGLVLKQTRLDGTRTGIMYGNDEVGYEIYIHLLNYLLATHQTIPRFTRVRSLSDVAEHTQYSLGVKTEYEIFQPLPSTHVMEMNWNGTVTPVQTNDGKKGIAFAGGRNSPLFFSNELIPALVRIIPRLFQPREKGFQVIYTHMMKPEVRKMVRPLNFTPYEELFPSRAGNHGRGVSSEGRFENRAFRVKPKGPVRGLRARRRMG